MSQIIDNIFNCYLTHSRSLDSDIPEASSLISEVLLEWQGSFEET